MNKIIFFFEKKLSKRDYDRYGFELLQNRGFEIEAWDFSPYFSPTFYENYNPSDLSNFKGIIEIKSKDQMKNNISNIVDGEVVISILAYEGKELGIYRELRKKKVHLHLMKNSYIIKHINLTILIN